MGSEKVELRDVATRMHAANDIQPAFYSKLLWLTICIKAQLLAIIELVRIRKEVNVVLFYLAYPFYLAHLLTAKLLGKKAVEVVTHSHSAAEKGYVNSWIFRLQERIMFSLLDGIAPESKGILNSLDLKKHKHKILTEGARFVDTSRFRVTTKFENRDLVVGYIGRLIKEKGITELVDAIPLIAKRKHMSFLIGGTGACLAEVKKASERLSAEEAVSAGSRMDRRRGVANLFKCTSTTHTADTSRRGLTDRRVGGNGVRHPGTSDAGWRYPRCGNQRRDGFFA
jgi:glycosyltransferase involved in cell wall biosynthesis